MTHYRSLNPALAGLCAVALVAACGDDNDGAQAKFNPHYGMSSSVSGENNEQVSFLTLLEELEPQAIDTRNSFEFPGSADMWSYNGSVYIAEAERREITRNVIENGDLVQKERVSFGAYGLNEFGFWLNTFISPTKAYFIHGTTQIIVWNPTTMMITKTIPLPQETRAGFMPYTSYTDRAGVVRDGKMYLPMYWTDSKFFKYTPDTRIAVFDIATDTMIEVLSAPCPGIDFATVDDAKNIYFSSWIFAPGGAYIDATMPRTCIAKLGPEPGAVPVVAWKVNEIAGGREGGALRYMGNNRALLSVLHPEHATATDVETVTYGANWQFWTVDLTTGAATQNTTIDWNAGAAYSMTIDGQPYMLVPGDGYATSTLYHLTTPAPVRLFDTDGWAMRLFSL